MSNVKYITFVNEYGADDIIVFSFCQKHNEIARRLELSHVGVLGAGFIRFTVGSTCEDDIHVDTYDDELYVGAQCYGESSSLKIQSRGDDDTKIAVAMLQLKGTTHGRS